MRRRASMKGMVLALLAAVAMLTGTGCGDGDSNGSSGDASTDTDTDADTDTDTDTDADTDSNTDSDTDTDTGTDWPTDEVCDSIGQVDYPDEGVPPDMVSICGSPDDPVTSGAAAIISINPSGSSPNAFSGNISVAPELSGHVVGLPSITLEDSSPDSTDGFYYTVEGGLTVGWPETDWITSARLKISLEIECGSPAGDGGSDGGTDGGTTTKLVESTNEVEWADPLDCSGARWFGPGEDNCCCVPG
jgi:hypothetical protein